MTYNENGLINIFHMFLVELLQKKRCDRCQGELYLSNNEKLMMRSRWSICGRRKSIFKDTPFFSSKLCIFTKLKLILYWLIGIDLRGMVELLIVSMLTSRLTFKYLCPQYQKKYYGKINTIGGPGVIVEIDESKMGNRKYNRGHHVEGVLILGL
ncbi:hypothetical protein DMUE_3314 [Dictyocoela muelleri]|nr:hypothetical protein DMUE_3314 [Dictyocoela muelleri]